MSQFNYADYQKVVEKAQNGGSNAVKVGFFKLKNDGDEALVRINCKTMDDLDFASVHTINANGRWMRVSCLNPLNAYGHHCKLCEAAANGVSTISKASKKVYLQMLVSYKDKLTGQFTAPQPVIWERPAKFSTEIIANKLRDYGDLTQVLFKVTRNGKPGDMKTTYVLDYAMPSVFKPEMIPADFSAFNNFNIAKHSYWEKTEEEIDTFLQTGAFPEVVRATSTAQPAPQIASTPVQSAPAYTAQAAQAINPQTGTPGYTGYTVVTPATVPAAQAQATPVVSAPAPIAEPTQPATSVEQPATRPVRNFNGFSF